jgi:predicted dehydrogenase
MFKPYLKHTMMKNSTTRREFLKQTSVLAGGFALLAGAPAIHGAISPSRKIRVGIVGCNGRGMGHISAFARVPNVEITYICDVDSRAIKKGIDTVARNQSSAPKGEKDIRRMLEDPELDAVSIAMPDHWHTPAAVLACAAGKHVYLEKPGSHNAAECAMVVAAARKHKRVVQLGNQRRTWPWVVEAIEGVRGGEIGEVHFARCWYANRRDSIGYGKPAPVPDWLDYSLWQGPAPERPYKDNIIHYNWHWFWDWGTAELGGNGVHAIDLALWGMNLELPKRITCGGNRYFHKDDWEMPDTTIATYDYGHKGISWEGQSCAPRGFEGSGFGVLFYGDQGTMVISGTNAVFYDSKNKVLREISGKQKNVFEFDYLHFSNFIDGITDGKPLKAEIEEGQQSALMCHLGNIAWRSGRTVEFDPKSRKLLNKESDVRKFWGRTYRKGWQPKV